MYLFQKIKKTGVWGFILMYISAVSFSSCQEHIDTSDLYTFTGETVSSFLSKDTIYSNYYELLSHVQQSTMTQSTVESRLSARGNYTCFAPTNAAVNAYLDTMMNVKHKITTKDITEFIDSVKKGSYVYDSIAKVIVYNSIIDCGSETAYETAVFPSDGTFAQPNMNDRYLTASTKTETGEKMTYIINGNVTITQTDNEVENGYVHQVNAVIAPTDANVFDLMQGMDNMTFFSTLLQQTGWCDSLTRYMDEEYEELYASSLSNTSITMGGSLGWAQNAYLIPEHRKYGFTVFVETDDVFDAAFAAENITGENRIEMLRDYLQKKYGNDDTFRNLTWGTTSEDLKDPMNAINQFVSYHLLPISLMPNRIVQHFNELGFDVKAAYNGIIQPTIPVFEYYETMTGKGAQRRLMKITESKTSNGIRINRYMKCNTADYQEDPALTDGPIEGALINTASATQAENTTAALNGYIYPIDQMLVYNDEVTDKVLNERLRFDLASLIPELINLGYRRPMAEIADGKTVVYFPVEYKLQNLEAQEGTKILYLSGYNNGWYDYQGDEFIFQGTYDFTLKLPPVPTSGTYEIRYGISSNSLRGMAQVYFGENSGSIVPQPAGIPLDLRVDMRSYGWEEDTDDDNYNNEVTKNMRNHDHMKAPKYFEPFNTGYNEYQIGRRIIVRTHMDANKTYYLRLKSVLDDTGSEGFFDYIEIVPSIVYNNPTESEDAW